ncbi:TIGR03790 family protein [bacterium]|nr:TIGR03790 family protein [bacterium]
MFRFLILLFSATPLFALEPGNIVVIANKDMPDSVSVARHYASKRKVPDENIVLLSLPKGEDILRGDFEVKLAEPLRESIKSRKDSIKVLLCVYGVPLRVGGKVLSVDEKAKADEIKKSLDSQRKELEVAEKDKVDKDKIDGVKKKIADLNSQYQFSIARESIACVDSELMCLWWKPYELNRWQPNPLYWKAPEEVKNRFPDTLMTCRLDGPTADIAKRLVDDAIEVEANGLKGKVYFDARGISMNPKNPGDASGYGGYDESFREAAALLKSAGMDVTLDDKGALFEPDSCKDAALYSGWYSHANFIDCCKYVKGAVAWHLASSEAVTLRNPMSKVWCPNLLQKGVAATLGPVFEPYTIGFPKPAEFFGFLATGKYTLVETYSRTIYLTSWMTVLVGDPLYNPYKNNPILKEEMVYTSPKSIPGK